MDDNTRSMEGSLCEQHPSMDPSKAAYSSSWSANDGSVSDDIGDGTTAKTASLFWYDIFLLVSVVFAIVLIRAYFLWSITYSSIAIGLTLLTSIMMTIGLTLLTSIVMTIGLTLLTSIVMAIGILTVRFGSLKQQSMLLFCLLLDIEYIVKY